ncbi:MAG: iron-sulfur cluster repair di-iron protein [Ignavibacteria bacterium]|nr:iron-sulfur cluster repair di-iron protein [Ignavibacteria bacterium]
MKDLKKLKTAEIVNENFRASAFFEKIGIDYCCHGEKTLEEACMEKGLNPDIIAYELGRIKDFNTRFEEWDVSFLIDYIINNHHSYVKATVPLIEHHINKVIGEHGTEYTELSEIAEVFATLKEDLVQHLLKEERMLFPYIKKMYIAEKNSLELPPSVFGSVINPIRVMQTEHDNAGRLMEKINELTDGFSPPPNACQVFMVLYNELRDFQYDLHVHVHLENNVLFPKALDLEDKIKRTFENKI